MAIGWALVSLGSHAETFFAPAITGAVGRNWSQSSPRPRACRSVCSDPWGIRGLHVAGDAPRRCPCGRGLDRLPQLPPRALHLTRRARGKHVLVEKPMAISVAEAVDMVQTCQAHGVKLGVGFPLRRHPGHQEARRLIREGHLGTMTLVHAQWGAACAGSRRSPPCSSWPCGRGSAARGGGCPSRSVGPLR